jgi:WD40 repeat protein
MMHMSKCNLRFKTVLAAAVLAGGMLATSPLLAQSAREVLPARTLELPADRHVGQPPVVTAVAISLDGRYVAAAGDDHLVRVWDLPQGRLLHTLRGHVDWVRTVAFSPASPVLASAGDDRQIIWWDLTTGHRIKTLNEQAQAVSCLRYSPDGRTLASIGYEKQMHLYDGVTGELSGVMACPCRDMRALAYSPDGLLMAAAGRNGKLRVWKTGTSETVFELDHDRRVRCLAFSTDGTQLAAAGDSQLISLLDARTGQELLTVPSRQGRVMSMTFCGPSRLATGGSDDSIRIWNLETRCEELRLLGHKGSVGTLAFEPSLGVLVSGSFDTSLRVWKLSETIREAAQGGRVPR